MTLLKDTRRARTDAFTRNWIGQYGSISDGTRRRIMAMLRASSRIVVFGKPCNIGSIGCGSPAAMGGAAQPSTMAEANVNNLRYGVPAIVALMTLLASTHAYAQAVPVGGAGYQSPTLPAGDRSFASGSGSNASGNDANASGSGSKASGNGSNASGFGATSSGTNSNASGSENSSGTGAVAKGDYSNASGAGAQALGNDSDASGVSSVATGDDSIAGGTLAQAKMADSIAMGHNAVATNVGDVALGANSITATATGVGFATGTAAPASVVSIGAAGSERRLTNLSAGSASTDAVNVSQLSQVATNTATTLGGGAAYDPVTGAYTPPSYTVSGTAYNSVGSALTAENTAVTNLASAFASGSFGPVQQSGVPGTLALVAPGGTGAAPGAAQKLTNLAAGTVSSGSLDAVNGDQLNAVAQTAANSVQYDNAGKTSLTLGGASATTPVALTNVAAGGLSSTSTDAVNGSQLFTTNTYLSALTTSVANGTVGPVQQSGTAGILTLVAPGGSGAVAGTAQKLTNLAAGAVSSSSTDAVNGSQLYDVTQTAANSVQYDNAGKTSLTLGGASSTTPVAVTNVAVGGLSSTSTDAVNGSQLFSTNQQVMTNTTNISSLDGRVTTVEGNVASLNNSVFNGAGIKYFHASSTLADSQANGMDSIAVGPQAIAHNTNSVALGNNAVASVDGALALGANSTSDRAISPSMGTIAASTGFIPYNTSDAGPLLGAVSVGNASTGSYRQITNVADGTEAHDAVTIRQLQGAIGSVATTPVKYFHANSSAGDALAVGAESIAVGPTTVVNGDNGIGIGNGAIVQMTAPGGTAIGQNAEVGQSDAIALGTNSKSDGLQSVAVGAGANASFSGSVALGAGATTSVGSRSHYVAYGIAAPQTSAGEVSVGSSGAERQVTNVAAGSAATDAVNVSQLAVVAQNSAMSLGGGASYDVKTGTYSAPSYSIDGKAYNNVGDALTAEDTAVTTLTTNVTNGTVGTVQRTANPNQLTLVAPGGSSTSPGAAQTLSNVAAGTAGTDAVNVKQLQQALGANQFPVKSSEGSTFNGKVGAAGSKSLAIGTTANATATNSTAIGEGATAGTTNSVALGAGSITRAATSTAGGMIGGHAVTYAAGIATGAVSVGTVGGERQIQNVAAGQVTASSTDAVNGSQLYVTQTAVSSLASSAVTYTDSNHANGVTINPGGTAAQFHNLAAGSATNDAVNVGQLNAGMASTLNAANTYTDGRINQVSFDLNQVAKRAYAGTAAAIALQPPQIFAPGKISMRVGTGLYRGEIAVGASLRATADNGRWSVSGGISGGANAGLAASAGVDFVIGQ